MSKKCQKRLNSLRIRIFMGTVYKRIFALAILFCNSLIRHQHEIFYDISCNVMFIWLYIDGSSGTVQYDLALREIKIDRPTVMSPASQKRRKLFHQEKHRHQFPTLPTDFCITVFKDLSYLIITHAAVYAYNCFCNLMIHYTACLINIHQAAECQTVFSLIQRTNTI